MDKIAMDESIKINTILFLCMGNSIRSIMAEAILNHLGQGRLKAYSAGAYPMGKVNPLVLAQLEKMGISTKGLYSKSIEECLEESGNIDCVISVCHSRLDSNCPEWFIPSIKVHWDVPDPTIFNGKEFNPEKAFETLAVNLSKAIIELIQITSEPLNKTALEQKLNKLSLIFKEQ